MKNLVKNITNAEVIGCVVGMAVCFSFVAGRKYQEKKEKRRRQSVYKE